MRVLNFWAFLLLLVAVNFLYNLYGPSGYSYESIGYAGILGVATGVTFVSLLIGAILWTPLRFFKGSEGAPGVRDFSLKSAYFISAVFVAIGYLTSPSDEMLSQRDREEFFQEASQGCFQYNMSIQGEAGLSTEEIQAFCECYGRVLSQDITHQEASELFEAGNISESLERKILAANAWCDEGY